MSDSISYIAGISKDKRNLSILISNYEGKDEECTVRIKNMDGKYRLAYYIIDSSHHLQIFREENASSFYESHVTIKKNSVIFIYAAKSSFPPEGPTVATIPLILRLRILDPFFALLRFLYIVLG